MLVRQIVAAAALAAFTSTAHAGVIDYTLAKVAGYEQTVDDTAPTTLAKAELFGQLAVDDPTDFDAVSLGGAASSPVPFTPFFGGFDWELFAGFPTLADLDTAFPDGSYTIDAAGSPGLGTFSESVTLSGSYPDIPFFTGTVLSDAQGLDPSLPFTFAWNAPPVDGFFLFLDEVGVGEAFFVDGFGSSAASAVLPGGTLLPDTDYEAVLTFVSLTADVRDSFSEGVGRTGFASETIFQFSTGPASLLAPEPSSALLLTIGTLSIAAWRRRRRA